MSKYVRNKIRIFKKKNQARLNSKLISKFPRGSFCKNKQLRIRPQIQLNIKENIIKNSVTTLNKYRRGQSQGSVINLK